MVDEYFPLPDESEERNQEEESIWGDITDEIISRISHEVNEEREAAGNASMEVMNEINVHGDNDDDILNIAYERAMSELEMKDEIPKHLPGNPGPSWL